MVVDGYAYVFFGALLTLGRSASNYSLLWPSDDIRRLLPCVWNLFQTSPITNRSFVHQQLGIPMPFRLKPARGANRNLEVYLSIETMMFMRHARIWTSLRSGVKARKIHQRSSGAGVLKGHPASLFQPRAKCSSTIAKEKMGWKDGVPINCINRYLSEENINGAGQLS